MSRRYFCSKEDKPLEPEEIVRGYEMDDGSFVTVTEEELDELEPRKSREIDLTRFVEREELDPISFERGYFLVPAGDTNKPYRLLARAMEEKGQAGIASFVMRGKQYLTAILADNGILRAEILRYAGEIRSPQSIGLPGAEAASATAQRFVDEQLKTLEGHLELSDLDDPSQRDLHELVRKKREEGNVIETAPQETAQEAEVVDIVALLKQRLREEEPAGKKKGKRSAR